MIIENTYRKHLQTIQQINDNQFTSYNSLKQKQETKYQIQTTQFHQHFQM
ncbi:hypothetical protein TTHERM_01462170 (macronuclear) [Tetrahymena thermophila SB210]|uniref:Uncharacterized protein n=1 Tax=Tetrahymena thermophila (strain SB210) TaxID=312017 RepID=Q228Z8_TETTS|nr:hypothetical protein TTHERM_01462170 [Tetrahymena thermophila SB210]EAR81863.1 hypothetical protein TTHERM_01462170 [Tetrahymena thermophila SB210]|eukprot:XP_001029526.1 hypothetical protein TTHERM_01462170 [Tetrahymena thermophila SB210]